jgi:hypothetical protein
MLCAARNKAALATDFSISRWKISSSVSVILAVLLSYFDQDVDPQNKLLQLI